MSPAPKPTSCRTCCARASPPSAEEERAMNAARGPFSVLCWPCRKGGEGSQSKLRRCYLQCQSHHHGVTSPLPALCLDDLHLHCTCWPEVGAGLAEVLPGSCTVILQNRMRVKKKCTGRQTTDKDANEVNSIFETADPTLQSGRCDLEGSIAAGNFFSAARDNLPRRCKASNINLFGA